MVLPCFTGARVGKRAASAAGLKSEGTRGGTDELNGSIKGMVECVTEMTEHVMAPKTTTVKEVVREELKDTVAAIDEMKRVLEGLAHKFSTN